MSDFRLAAQAVENGMGAGFSLRLGVRHEGAWPTADLALRFAAPPGLSWLAGQPAAGVIDWEAGLWRLGSLAPGQSLTLVLTGTQADTLAATPPELAFSLTLAAAALGAEPLARLVAPLTLAPPVGEGALAPPDLSTLAPGGGETVLAIAGAVGFDVVQVPLTLSESRLTPSAETLRLEAGQRILLIEAVEALRFTDGAAFALAGRDASVASLYSDLLRRPPDAEGFAFWREAADTVPFGDLVRAVARSPEFAARLGPLAANEAIATLYASMLDRAPEQEALRFWSGALASGAHPADLAAALSASEAYAAVLGVRQGAGLWFDAL